MYICLHIILYYVHVFFLSGLPHLLRLQIRTLCLAPAQDLEQLLPLGTVFLELVHRLLEPLARLGAESSAIFESLIGVRAVLNGP